MTHPQKEIKVGILDDEPDMTDLIRNSLEDSGYTIYSSNDGAAFLRYIEAKKPDLVILDLMMPALNGLDILYIIKTKYPDIRTIVLSGTAESRNIRESSLLSDLYLSKPFEHQQLKDAAAELLK